MKRLYCLMAGLLWTFATFAQDGNKFLLLTREIEFEATDAIFDMYNFSFQKAQTQFEKIRQRHIDHPLPYFLMAMNQWWQLMPYYGNRIPAHMKSHENMLLSYLDTSITKAEKYYEVDSTQIEAAFFLSAAYGLKARYYTEIGGDRMEAVMPAKHALKYFKRTNENNALSPEFLFGSALFNYYGEWFRSEYPMLKPVLVLFPKGDSKLGLQQMEQVATSAFYTRAEARYFLFRIYHESDKDDVAIQIIKKLWEDYPNNAYFQKMFARLAYEQGWPDTYKGLAQNYIYKYSIKLPGYEESGLRYSYYFLAKALFNDKKYEQAREYFIRTVLLSEATNMTHMSYYIESVHYLGVISRIEKDYVSAKQYFNTVVERASKKSKDHLKTYLKSTFELGFIAKEQKNYTEARKHFKTIMQYTRSEYEKFLAEGDKDAELNVWQQFYIDAEKELGEAKPTRNKIKRRAKK